MINQEFRRKSAINHQLEKGHLNFHCRNVKSGFDKEKLIMKRCIKGGFSVLSGFVGVVPVSYTHLDVYKRQPIMVSVKSAKSRLPKYPRGSLRSRSARLRRVVLISLYTSP